MENRLFFVVEMVVPKMDSNEVMKLVVRVRRWKYPLSSCWCWKYTFCMRINIRTRLCVHPFLAIFLFFFFSSYISFEIGDGEGKEVWRRFSSLIIMDTICVCLGMDGMRRKGMKWKTHFNCWTSFILSAFSCEILDNDHHDHHHQPLLHSAFSISLELRVVQLLSSWWWYEEEEWSWNSWRRGKNFQTLILSFFYPFSHSLCWWWWCWLLMMSSSLDDCCWCWKGLNNAMKKEILSMA